jgi:hypothetical protein
MRRSETESLCPWTSKVVRFFRDSSSNKTKTRIVDHLTNCALCLREFELFLSIKRSAEFLDKEIDNWISSQNNFKSHYTRRHINSFSSGFLCKYAPFIFGIAFLALSFIIIFKQDPLSSINTMERENHTEKIELLLPAFKASAKSDVVFRWEKKRYVDYYQFELFDDALLLIWESPKLTENTYQLPDSIQNKLSTSKTYVWMVSAMLKSGEIIESPLRSFRLAN